MADVKYDSFGVSDEPLEIIRANECEYDPGSLSTRRFRRLWNEIVDLRAELKTANDKSAVTPKDDGAL